jgi:hypothetical protein
VRTVVEIRTRRPEDVPAVLKPEIPVAGAYGIPLRDELVLDKPL